MSKINPIPALSAKHRFPQHHRVWPQSFQRAFQELSSHCYCTNCGAIGFQKRWYIDPETEQSLRQDERSNAVLCPGCTMVEQQIYQGEVVLANSKCRTNMDEIEARIRHTEGRCWYNNPTAKIVAVTEEDKILHVQTTTSVLAERIGKELHKAFKGQLEVKRAPGEKFVRVYWTD